MNTKQKQFPEEKEFSECLRNLSCKIMTGQSQYEELRKKFLKRLNDFSNRFRRHLMEGDALSRNLPIPVCFNELALKTCESFQKANEQLLHQENFQETFQDRFIIFIYGKVKCGKSSLGNLIAQYASDQAKFFRFEDANKEVSIQGLEELSDDAFEVKATEATTAIQGFRLPGLYWIDSPGLHSVTKENGELSEKYIAAADLVLFLAKSEDSARASNLEEISRLLNRSGKSMVVVLTRSDESEQDEVDGEIVTNWYAKSPESRKVLEEDMVAKIREVSADSSGELLSEIFSVSKKIADKAHQQNSLQLWRESNIGQLLKTLIGILNESAIRLKAKAPLDQLTNALQELLHGRKEKFSLQNLKEHLSKIQDDLRTNQSEFKHAFQNMKCDLELDSEECCEQIFHDASISESQKKELLAKLLDSKLDKRCEEYLLPVLKKGLLGIKQGFALVLDQNLFKIEDQYEEIRISTDYRNTGSAVGGTIGSLLGGLGFLAGPVVGLATVALGGVLGGMIGNEVGSNCSNGETIQVKAGDDAISKLTALKAVIRQNFTKHLEQMQDNIEQQVYQSVSKKITCLLKEIDVFRRDMEKLTRKGM
jgi:predicted GTPase